MGDRGVLAAVPGAVMRVPAFKVKVTDPTGAGDAFSAGLILRIYRPSRPAHAPETLSVGEWKDILVYASACGAACCQGIGTTAAVTAENAARLVKRHGRALAEAIRVEGSGALNRTFPLFLFCVLMASSCSVRDPVPFEYRIPPGWHVRNVGVSERGLKALVIWQNVPNDQALKGDFASRLLLFDKAGRPVCDLQFNNPRVLQMTRDDRVILEEGHEWVDRITVFDARGRRLFETPTNRRGPVPALLGKEIGLWETNGPFSQAGTWEVSIIRGDTGEEKFKFALTVQGASLYCGFLPIGEGGRDFMGWGPCPGLILKNRQCLAPPLVIHLCLIQHFSINRLLFYSGKGWSICLILQKIR